MTSPKEKYDAVRDIIRTRPVREVSRTTGVLPAIMREANNGNTEFNAAALERHGIDPVDFRTTQAINYATITLGYNDYPIEPFGGVLIARLERCLNEDDDMSFGRLLPDDLKELVKEKLELNRPFVLRGTGPKPSF